LISLGHRVEALGRTAGNDDVQSLAGESARKCGSEPCRGTHSDDDRCLLVAHLALLY
jgi:hypothetical protein